MLSTELTISGGLATLFRWLRRYPAASRGLPCNASLLLLAKMRVMEEGTTEGGKGGMSWEGNSVDLRSGNLKRLRRNYQGCAPLKNARGFIVAVRS